MSVIKKQSSSLPKFIITGFLWVFPDINLIRGGGGQILKNAWQISEFGRHFKGITQNSTRKLKVEILFYVDSTVKYILR